MAGTFGRRSRGSSRFQSGGSWRSSKRRIVKVSKSKAGIVKNHKNQTPNRTKFTASSKAGRGKSQQQGSESGSSKQLSSLPSPSVSSESKPSSSEFEASGGRRRRRRPRFSITAPISSPLHTTSASATATAIFLWSFGRRATKSNKKTIFSPSSSCSSSFIIVFLGQICEKDGRDTAARNDVVEIGDEEWRRRNRGSSRRPHCALYGAQGPSQQGLYCERAERSSGSSFGSHRHTILRRPRPSWLRPTQQGRGLAHQKGQIRHRRACGAAGMESEYLCSQFQWPAAKSAATRAADEGERRFRRRPPSSGGRCCF